ncbi:MAG TPA: hypothetical protein VFZ85_17580 [Jiangellaceae bacterium]
MDETWVPAACTLPTAERPIRVAEFDALLGTAVRGVARMDETRLRLELDPSPDVAGQAAQLAAKETGCCSFFTFTLTADGAGVRLDVAVPEGRTDVLDALASLARP